MKDNKNDFISFSLWGENPAYINGLERNILAAKLLYPGWKVVIFVHIKTLAKLNCINFSDFPYATLIPVQFKPSWSGMFWRMLPILWGHSRYVLIRDIDSTLTERESIAVQSWMGTGRPLHIMRDHPAHAAPIMGGMFGVDARSSLVRQAFSRLKTIIYHSQLDNRLEYWQADQNYLASEVYPILKDHSYVNDPFFQGLPFPETRKGLSFVGQAFEREEQNIEIPDDEYSLLKVEQYLASLRHMSKILGNY